MIIYKEESYKILGACFSVHSELGCGFLEGVYHEALAKELAVRKIPFQEEAKLDVIYKNEYLDKKYYADFICYDKIILELKACENISDMHIAQVLNYLSATNLRLGIIVNFGSKSLTYKRIVK
jgi:GxxExxY protein